MNSIAIAIPNGRTDTSIAVGSHLASCLVSCVSGVFRRLLFSSPRTRTSRMYIPSEEMGDYEDYRSRQKKKSGGVLYPLDEEGTYGAPPAALPKPLPGYLKRDRKPKVYASYAVSSDCSMHAAKLESNESQSTLGRKQTPPRGRTPPTRRSSAPTRPKDPTPTRPKDPTPTRTKDPTPTRPKDPAPTRPKDPAPAKTKWQNTLRDSGYSNKPGRWQDSLRGGRDSISPSTPQPQRRPSTKLRNMSRGKSSSVSPNRSRTISASPDRLRRQSMSPDGVGQMGSGRSSSSWGYTDFSTFTANRKSSDYSSSSQRKASTERRSSQVSERRESSGRRGSTREYSGSSGDYSRKSSSKDYSVAQDYPTSPKNYTGSSRDNLSSSKDYSSSPRDYTSPGKSSRSSSPVKIGLSVLKTPQITEWDQMGVLGLSSKMFKESTNKKETMFSSSSSSSFMRKESFTAKVM
jgi:hypothetical protein